MKNNQLFMIVGVTFGVVLIITFVVMGKVNVKNSSSVKGAVVSADSVEKLLNTVSIEGSMFNPTNITVPKGTMVTWINNDNVPHKVVSDPYTTHSDLPGLESKTINPGESYSYTFNILGSWVYHCHFKPEMQGRVIVTP